MKIVATLPPKEHFHALPPVQNQNVWVDKASKAFQISATFNPFAKEVVIVLSQQRQKTDKTEYPYKMVFKCFESGDGAIPAIIHRERFKGVFAMSQRHSEYGYPLFLAVPTEERNLWLSYSIFLKN